MAKKCKAAWELRKPRSPIQPMMAATGRGGGSSGDTLWAHLGILPSLLHVCAGHWQTVSTPL